MSKTNSFEDIEKCIKTLEKYLLEKLKCEIENLEIYINNAEIELEDHRHWLSFDDIECEEERISILNSELWILQEKFDRVYLSLGENHES